MEPNALKSERLARHRISKDSGNFEEFKSQTSKQTRIEDWPFADSVEENILIYKADSLIRNYENETEFKLLLAELVEAFSTGPGVIAIKGAIADTTVVDAATTIFEKIIVDQKQSSKGSGDHFAKAGANDRIWNAVEKHCLSDPSNFIKYYSNLGLAIPCEAWLGAGYQITAQVNRVNPGGGAQKPHRDYHLGFMAPEQMERYPAHVHQLSPMLTLQGAVAHCNMPIESGPTQLLPYSQEFREGYLAFSRPEFQVWFADNHVQLPLEKGDAVFFNPALMHAAGNNRTKDIYRMANLLQISSAFGHAMETVNHSRMVKRVFPELAKSLASGALNEKQLNCVIEAVADGYPFPTNLDTDPPIEGMAPRSQVDLLSTALRNELTVEEVCAAVALQDSKRRS